jgi:hypothetical protein
MIRERLLETGETGTGRSAYTSRDPAGDDPHRAGTCATSRVGRIAAQAHRRADGEDSADADANRDENPDLRRERRAPPPSQDWSDTVTAGGPPAAGAVAPRSSSSAPLLATCARSVGRFDGFAGVKLREELDEMALWLNGSADDGMMSRRLRGAAQTRIGAAARGRAACMPTRTPGASGRPHVVIGLDDAQFPGGPAGPASADGERSRLDAAPWPAAGRLESRPGSEEAAGRCAGR